MLQPATCALLVCSLLQTQTAKQFEIADSKAVTATRRLRCK